MAPRNPYICLAIVATLAAVLILGTAGIVLLATLARPTPEALIAIVGGTAGSLSSFLVSVPRGSVGGDGNNEAHTEREIQKT